MFDAITKMNSRSATILPPLPMDILGKTTRNIIKTTIGEDILNSETVQQLISGQVFYPTPARRTFTEPTIGMPKLIEHVKSQIDLKKAVKTAVVTGVNGAVGCYLSELLLGLGYKVIGLDINDHQTLDLNKIGGDRYLFQIADITDKEGLLNVLNGNEVKQFLGKDPIDKLFHSAAIFKVNKNVPWKLFEAVNIQGAVNVAEVVKELKIPAALFWGTAAMYNGHNEPCNEETPIKMEALTDYERSKYLGYLAVEKYRQAHDLPISYIEPTGIIGPYNTYAIGQASKLIANGLLVANFGDTVEFSIVFAADVVGAGVVLVHKLRNDPKKYAGERYIIADDVPMRFPDLTLFMRKVTNDREPYPWIRVPDVLVPIGGEAIEYWTDFSNALFNVKFAPVLEKGMVEFITSNRISDNTKSKTVYKYLYPNVISGAEDYWAFLKHHDLLPGRHPFFSMLNIIGGDRPPGDKLTRILEGYDQKYPTAEILDSYIASDTAEIRAWASKMVKDGWYQLVDVCNELDNGHDLRRSQRQGKIPLTPVPVDLKVVYHFLNGYLGHPKKGLFGKNPNLLTIITSKRNDEILYCCAEKAKEGVYVDKLELHTDTKLMKDLLKLVTDAKNGAAHANLTAFENVLKSKLEPDFLPGVIKIANIDFFGEIKSVFDQYEKDQNLTIFMVGMLKAVKQIFDRDLIRFVPNIGIFDLLKRVTRFKNLFKLVDGVHTTAVDLSDLVMVVKSVIPAPILSFLPIDKVLTDVLKAGLVLVLKDEHWVAGMQIGVNAEGNMYLEVLDLDSMMGFVGSADRDILKRLGKEYPNNLILVVPNPAVLDLLHSLTQVPTRQNDVQYLLGLVRTFINQLVVHRSDIKVSLGIPDAKTLPLNGILNRLPQGGLKGLPKGLPNLKLNLKTLPKLKGLPMPIQLPKFMKIGSKLPGLGKLFMIFK